MKTPRLRYTTALATWDPGRIVQALADDVTIRVAVHDGPLQGLGVARFLFGVLSEELDRPALTGEIVEGERAVVLFESAIGGRAAQGLNVVALDPSGRVGELTVFFRPLESLQRIADVVGARMAAQFGPMPT